jgi:hypothetical protein
LEALETGGEAVLGTGQEEGGNAIRIAVVIVGQRPKVGTERSRGQKEE